MVPDDPNSTDPVTLDYVPEPELGMALVPLAAAAGWLAAFLRRGKGFDSDLPSLTH